MKNEELKKKLEEKYDKVGICENELIVVELNEKNGAVNKEGEIIIPLKYDNMCSYITEEMELIPVKLRDKWGFIDKQGKLVISCKYDNVQLFCEGLSGVIIDNKSGFINMLGKEVIPLKYKFVCGFKDGLSVVVTDEDKEGLINKEGEEVILCKYNFVTRLLNGNIDRFVYAQIDTECGFIDLNKFKEFIPFKHTLKKQLGYDGLDFFYVLFYTVYEDSYIIKLYDFIGFIDEFEIYLKDNYKEESSMYKEFMSLVEKIKNKGDK